MTDIDTLIAKDAVARVIRETFVGTDEMDWDRVHRAFAPRVLLDMTSMGAPEATEMAADEITSAWDDGLKHLEARHHQIGNLEIEVDGDRAAATCYGSAWHYLPNPAGSTRCFVGTYDFGLSRMDGEWRIDLLRFNLKFIDGNADLEGTSTND